ncbi:MAG TPA: IS607 family transposase, partial [Mitsuokella multacida]|nr:IS607 family transposase [Mitsuokella multacida]
VNNEDLSPEREMIQDLISIIRMFSIRIHGLGKYEGQLKGDETIAQILQDRTPSHRKPNG